MADITMCMDNECPQNKTCYRYNAIPNEFRQSYFANSPRKGEDCEYYYERANIHRSPIIQEILDSCKKDPWYIKLKRWLILKTWVYTCLTRKYWDKTFEGYIFKKKKK